MPTGPSVGASFHANFEGSVTSCDLIGDNYWPGENDGAAGLADDPANLGFAAQLHPEPTVNHNCSALNLDLGAPHIGSTGLWPFHESTFHSPPLHDTNNFSFGYPSLLPSPGSYLSTTYSTVNNGVLGSNNAFEVSNLPMGPGGLESAAISLANISQHVVQLAHNAATLPDSLLHIEATSSAYYDSPAVPINTSPADTSIIHDYQLLPTSIAPKIPNVIAIPPNPPSVNTTQDRSDGGGLLCRFPGCTRPISRARDLRRHLQKHSDQNRPCPVIGCHRKYYRRDKLKSHLLGGHKLDIRRVNELCRAW